MKNIILFIILICIPIFGQEGEQEMEIFIYTENMAGITADFYLNSVDGSVWWRNYANLTYRLENTVKGGNSIINSTVTITGNLCDPDSNKGWNNYIPNLDHIPPYFGHGYYKVSTDESSAYFYIDFRDCDYVRGSTGPPICYNPIDIFIKYDANSNIFWYSFTWGGGHPWIQITQGETLKSWETWTKNYRQDIQVTSEFELYLTISNNNNHPHLTWNPYHDLNWVDQYNIYRAYEENGQMTPYRHVASVDNSQLSWTDYGVNLRKPLLGGLKYFYKVNAEDNVGNQSLYSNREYIFGIGPVEKPIIIQDQKNSKFISSFILYDNQPNPFNPTTTISFDLPEESFVNLVVYDISGKKVATLVNDQLTEGSYSVKFDASNISSGIYIYKINAGLYSQIKRMLLIK